MSEPASGSGPAERLTNAGTVGRAALWSMLGNSTGQVMSLLLFLVIARFVSQESFGLMAVSLTVIEFVRRLVLDPLASSLNARSDATRRDYDACFTMILTASAVFAVGLAALAEPLARLIGSPEAAEVLPIVAIILAGMGLTRTHDVWLGRHMQFHKLAVRTIVSVLAGGAVGLTMAMNGFELWSLVGQQITITTVGAITLWIATPWRPRLLFARREFGQNLAQTRHISFANFWTTVSQDIDIIFVSGFFGPVATGLYNAAKRIVLAATLMLSHTVSAVSLSALANIPERDARSSAALHGLAVTSLVTLPAFAGMAAISEDLIALALGHGWEPAGPILAALALSGYALAIHQFCGSILMVEQRAHLNTICSAVASAAVVGLCWSVSSYGALAIAAAVSAGICLALPLRLEFARRAIGASRRQIASALLPSVVAAAAMWVLVNLLQRQVAPTSHLTALALVVPLAVLAYAAVIRSLAPAQFAMAYQLVGRILRRG